MKQPFIAMFLAAALPAIAVASANEPALTPMRCAELAKDDAEGSNRPDVVVFDHQAGQLVWPVPTRLEVPDEGIFVVVFKHTDSTKFDYSINSLDADSSKTVDLKADGQGVEVANDQIVCVSWKHHEEFPLYRVTISRRVTAEAEAKTDTKPSESEEAANAEMNDAAQLAAPTLSQPDARSLTERMSELKSSEDVEDRIQLYNNIEEIVRRSNDIVKSRPMINATHEALVAAQEQRLLFPYTFPIWVETSDAQLYFSTGLGFSTLTNERYFVRTDVNDPDDADDDTTMVERDHNGQDAFRPDLMAFTTLTAPNKRSWGWMAGRLGLSFGLGIGEDSSPRYFVGPSLVLSHRMTIALGAIGAQVKRLPAGQKLGEEPINGANTLSQLDSGFKVGLGLSFSFKLGKDPVEFNGALNPPQRVPEKEPAKDDQKKPDDTEN